MTRKQYHICSEVTHHLNCKYFLLHQISPKKTNGSTVRNKKIKGHQLYMFLVLIHPYSKNSICRCQPQKAVC